jgi:Fic family protein
MEESIASSLIEGVATTRQAARELIRSGRTPETRAELQVLNNYRAMQFVREISQDALTPENMLRIHRTLASGWLEDGACGVLRSGDDVVVEDSVTGEVLHRPPPAAELPARLKRLCDFANGVSDTSLVHPLVRATALHFMLAYDHPFVDGNGRTARALFHWCMLRQGFRMYEYLAISRRILKRTTQYPRAFRLVETDDFDLTYFLEFQLTAVLGALKAAHEYLEAKQREHRRFLGEIRRLNDFNYRQQALLIRAVNQPDLIFNVKTHAFLHNVTLQTARRDLEDLQKAGLLTARRDGRATTWAAVDHIKAKLEARLPRKR